MSGVIRTLLDIARDGTTGALEASCTLAEVMPALAGAVEGQLEVEDRTAASTARIAAPRDLVVRAVAPLVDNALRHARRRITFTASDDVDHVDPRRGGRRCRRRRGRSRKPLPARSHPRHGRGRTGAGHRAPGRTLLRRRHRAGRRPRRSLVRRDPADAGSGAPGTVETCAHPAAAGSGPTRLTSRHPEAEPHGEPADGQAGDVVDHEVPAQVDGRHAGQGEVDPEGPGAPSWPRWPAIRVITVVTPTCRLANAETWAKASGALGWARRCARWSM